MANLRRNKVSWISETKIQNKTRNPSVLEFERWKEETEFNANMKILSFSTFPRNQNQLSKLVEDLTRPDLCVTRIIFDGAKFEVHIMEAFVNIFKRNLQIKTVKFTACDIPDACFARFCDALEYCHFESLELSTFLGPKKQFRMLAEGLKNNQTITKFKLKNQDLKDPGMFKYICKVLKSSPSITSFKLWAGTDAPNFKDLARQIHQNQLKHLTIRSNDIQLEQLSKSLEKNTSLQSLEFRSKSMSYVLLGEILRANNSIKKLKLNGSIMTINSISELKLSTNTSLKELSIVGCSPETGTTLFAELKLNTTLKSLRFAPNIQDPNATLDVEALQQFLEENKTITELNLPAISRRVLIYITNGLKFNTNLRKLSFWLLNEDNDAVLNFIRDLKHNRGLTHINLGPIFKQNKIISSIMENALVNLLAENKTLRYIESTEHVQSVEDKLKENRLEQDIIIKNMCTWIKMILMKPNSFILPIEVWSNIFKYTSYSFVPFDFEKFFNDSMA